MGAHPVTRNHTAKPITATELFSEIRVFGYSDDCTDNTKREKKPYKHFISFYTKYDEPAQSQHLSLSHFSKPAGHIIGKSVMSRSDG